MKLSVMDVVSFESVIVATVCRLNAEPRTTRDLLAGSICYLFLQDFEFRLGVLDRRLKFLLGFGNPLLFAFSIELSGKRTANLIDIAAFGTWNLNRGEKSFHTIKIFG